MTQKNPTSWTGNTSRTAGVTYNSSTTAYNSTTTSYSSSTSALATSGKLAEAWTKVSKTVTGWRVNPAAITSLYLYDSASILYDSTRTYDGVVSGQEFGNQDTPTAWSTL